VREKEKRIGRKDGSEKGAAEGRNRGRHARDTEKYYGENREENKKRKTEENKRI